MEDEVPVSVSSFELHIEGEARGSDRARSNPFNPRPYKTKKNTTQEAIVYQAWKEAGKPRLPVEMAIALKIIIVAVRPGGHTKRNGDLSAEGLRHPIPRNKKPDLDNAAKLVMDALNKRAWKDDVAVASLTIERTWGKWAATRVYAKVVDELPLDPWGGSGAQMLHQVRVLEART